MHDLKEHTPAFKPGSIAYRIYSEEDDDAPSYLQRFEVFDTIIDNEGVEWIREKGGRWDYADHYEVSKQLAIKVAISRCNNSIAILVDLADEDLENSQ